MGGGVIDERQTQTELSVPSVCSTTLCFLLSAFIVQHFGFFLQLDSITKSFFLMYLHQLCNLPLFYETDSELMLVVF